MRLDDETNPLTVLHIVKGFFFSFIAASYTAQNSDGVS